MRHRGSGSKTFHTPTQTASCFPLPTHLMLYSMKKQGKTLTAAPYYNLPHIAFVVLIQSFRSCRQRKHWIMTKERWSVCHMTCFSYSISAGLLPHRWAESSMRCAAYASSTPITNYTSTSSRHDLSSCVDGDARHSISYCAVCPWSWRHVYTTPIPLCLLPGSVPKRAF